jgi:hypothetical protein
MIFAPESETLLNTWMQLSKFIPKRLFVDGPRRSRGSVQRTRHRPARLS